jgi:hypothetical protein
MLKKLLWVVPLSLALSVIAADAKSKGDDDKSKKKTHAPEFDPRATGAALALLVGGVLLLSDLRRRRDPERG